MVVSRVFIAVSSFVDEADGLRPAWDVGDPHASSWGISVTGAGSTE
jgi:hypothetical protein